MLHLLRAALSAAEARELRTGRRLGVGEADPERCPHHRVPGSPGPPGHHGM